MSSYLFSCYIITRAEHPAVQNFYSCDFCRYPVSVPQTLTAFNPPPYKRALPNCQKAHHLSSRSLACTVRGLSFSPASLAEGRKSAWEIHRCCAFQLCTLSLSLSSFHHHHIHLIRSFNSLPKGTHALQTPVRSRSFPLTHSLRAHYRSVPLQP